MAQDGKFDAVKQGAERSHFQIFKKLFPYLWPADRPDLRTRVLLAALSLVVAKGVGVTVPFLFKYAIDRLTKVQALAIGVPLGLILAYGLARISQQLFGELRDFLFAKVSKFAQRTIGLRTFQHLHELSLSFHLERQTGGLSRVIERGTKGIDTLLAFLVFNILPTLLEVVMVTGIITYHFDWRYSITVLTAVVVYVGYSVLITDWRVKYRKIMNESDADANTKAIDSLLNYETVKYFGNEEHEHRRFDAALAKYERAAVKSTTSLSLLNVGQGTIIGAGLIILMVMAGREVVAGSRTIGDFVLVNTFLIQLYMPLNFLGFVYREIKQGLTDMDKMFELLDVNVQVVDRPDAKPLHVTRSEVQFRDVVFGYGPDRTILDGVSFKIAPGQTLAIVGSSGAGKSTVSRLLFRFYDVNSGSVLIDGQDIRGVTQKSLRASIGIVPQDTVLFNDTIRYNIEYGRPGATEEEIFRAARLAKIHDFIVGLPQGYGTRVGERGLKLSGGERQRVSIARTILKHPQILVFDEATSALDSHTEKEIQASLKEVSKDRTTLVIAHRLSTIVEADEIVVLKKGKIVERGGHFELLSAKGEYAAMWAKQQAQAEYEEKIAQAMNA
jgi:ATP-binding cassette, subfamily B, heavy metal transporter